MAVRKSELYTSLWNSCDELRGGMDASLYKDYVLTLLFIKYVTDRFKGDIYAEIEVPDGGSFDDLKAAKGRSDIGDRINKIISKLAEANSLVGIIDQADFDDDSKLGSDKEKVDKLTNLVAIFEDDKLDFRKNRAGGDDIIGDAYEYLMRKFATESGKSKGQFYTPAEVSRVMAKVIGIDKTTKFSQTVYDPACGSGSLLIRAADEAPNGITIYGQEYDPTTAGLAKMNLVLHNKSTGTIAKANTLSTPKFKNGDSLDRFDYAVANPPFSYKSWSNGVDTSSDPRFTGYGAVPPEKNGDFAWLMHFVYSLKPEKGNGAIILPHGVLFRGNAEAAIRQKMIDERCIKGIIGLPANLFYGTSIPACIIVIDKENRKARRGIFMIDASHGFIKDGNKNRLREQDIRKIVDCWSEQLEIPKYSRLVPFSEIAQRNEYNLNITRYIDSSEPEDLQEIEAHLKGGLPVRDIDELQTYWSAFPSLKGQLFEDFGRKGYCKLRLPKEDIRKAVFGNAEFEAYARMVAAEFETWKTAQYPRFEDLKKGDSPKKFIELIATDLLRQFADILLLDKYDVYERLMVYWDEAMQDDVYAIAFDGWEAGNEIIREYATKKNKDGTIIITDRVKAWDGRMIPRSIITDVYFPEEQDAITRLQTERDEIVRLMEEMREEESGEDGLLSSVIEKESITAKRLKERIKEIKDSADDAEELAALRKYAELMDNEATYSAAIKKAVATLDGVVMEKYPTLTVEEIKGLVINKKWCDTILDRIDALFSAISYHLMNRITELSERYADTLPALQQQVEDYEAKVKSHLERMGFTW